MKKRDPKNGLQEIPTKNNGEKVKPMTDPHLEPSESNPINPQTDEPTPPRQPK